MILWVKGYYWIFLQPVIWLLVLNISCQTLCGDLFSRQVRYYQAASETEDIIILIVYEGNTEVWSAFSWWMHLWLLLSLVFFLEEDRFHNTDHLSSIFLERHQLQITGSSTALFSYCLLVQAVFSWEEQLISWVVFSWVLSFLLSFLLFEIHSHFESSCEVAFFPLSSLQTGQNLSSSSSVALVQPFRKQVMLSSSLQQHSPLVIICFTLLKLSVPLVRILLEMVVPYVEIIVRKYLFELEYWEFLQVSWENLEELLQLLILLLLCDEALLLLWVLICVTQGDHHEVCS